MLKGHYRRCRISIANQDVQELVTQLNDVQAVLNLAGSEMFWGGIDLSNRPFAGITNSHVIILD